MRRVIERLREKPKEVRVQASFLAAVCVTGVIGLLWGVTVPARLQGLSRASEEGDETAQAEEADTIGSFFADTRNNLGQLIGAAGAPTADGGDGTEVNTQPSSDAYRAGAPEHASDADGYSFGESQPAIVPVGRREVRIGTTTSVEE